MDTSKPNQRPSLVPAQASRHAEKKETTPLTPDVPDRHLPSQEERLERVFTFDTSLYNFRQIIFDIFCTAPQVGEQLRSAALQDKKDIGIALSRLHDVQNKFWRSRGLEASQALSFKASRAESRDTDFSEQEPCKKIPRHDSKGTKMSKKSAKKLKKSSFYSVRSFLAPAVPDLSTRPVLAVTLFS